MAAEATDKSIQFNFVTLLSRHTLPGLPEIETDVNICKGMKERKALANKSHVSYRF